MLDGGGVYIGFHWDDKKCPALHAVCQPYCGMCTASCCTICLCVECCMRQSGAHFAHDWARGTGKLVKWPTLARDVCLYVACFQTLKLSVKFCAQSVPDHTFIFACRPCTLRAAPSAQVPDSMISGHVMMCIIQPPASH